MQKCFSQRSAHTPGEEFSGTEDANARIVTGIERIQAATRLRALHGPRIAIRGWSLSAGSGRAWPRRIDGTPGQSLRQRQGRELHEDAQGRGCLSGER